MASIKQLDERRYKITVSNGYRPNGKKNSKAKTIQIPPGVPKRGIGQYVAHAAEELERSFKTGYAEDGEMTFEEFASRWLKRQTKYAPSTIAAYWRMLEVVYPMIGGIRLNKLRPMALENMLSALRKRKHHGKLINESTVQRYLSVVSAVLSDAKRNEIIEKNPARMLDLPTPQRTVQRIPTRSEVEKLLDTLAKEPRHYRLFYLLSMYTGCRRGELCALQWSDFTGTQNGLLLTVSRSRSSVPGKGIVEGSTKNGKSREVYLSSDLRGILLAYKRRKQMEADKQRRKLSPYLFANELHAKDTSRKVRAVMKMKAEQGERLGGRPPYGYRKSDGDANTLVPDEDTAPVVKRIFSLCAAGNGPKRIATILTKEQVVNPSNAYYRKTGKSHRGLDTTRPCLWSSNSVTSILNNEVYLGHSVGLRTTTISYKNKQRVERPESERFVVKNTHEALVTQEQWDIVQEVRQHKKRVPKHMDEPNIFSGLVFCADCGKPLVLHRASTMKKAEYNFKCYTYGKKGKTVCTPHHIREFELKAVVLEDLRRVTHFARMKEKQFAAYISSKNTLELRREMNTIQKDLDTMRRRREELSKLFKRLYEDNVLGRVTDEQYRMLAGDYTVEQKALEEQILEKKALLEKLKAASANVNTFVEKAKQYTAIDELTPELLRLFIQRIEVGERTEKYSRSSHQSIRIVYRDIGTVDSAMEQGEAQPRIAPPLSEVFELPA